MSKQASARCPLEYVRYRTEIVQFSTYTAYLRISCNYSCRVTNDDDFLDVVNMC